MSFVVQGRHAFACRAVVGATRGNRGEGGSLAEDGVDAAVVGRSAHVGIH
jgi:hypothetical protein